jgi:hypothetical protein
MRPLTVVVTFLAAASAIGLGGYWLGQAGAPRALDQPRSAARTNISEPIDGNAELAEAIRQLDRRLAALELRELYAKPAEAQAHEGPPRASAVPLAPAEMTERELQKAAAIEAALKTEPRDSAWASVTERQLQTAVNAAVQEGAQYSVKTLSCLTSICEMVLSASSPDKLNNTTLQLARSIDGMSSFDIVPPKTAADGSATLTYRLFRKSYPRPDEGT